MTAFGQIAERLGLGEMHPILREAWPASEALFAAGRAPLFEAEPLAEEARRLGMPDDFIADLAAAIPVVEADPVLSAYLFHCRRLLSDPAAGWPVFGAGFPVINPDSSPAARMGYALVFLALVPGASDLFRQRGIPDGVILDTLGDFVRWTGEHKRIRGAWGLTNLGWLQNHLRARLFALGRLQFKLEQFGPDFHGWRERATGRVLLLAGEGMRFQPPGLLAYGECVVPVSGSWAARYREESGAVEGMPVDPRGFVGDKPVRLSLDRWEPILKKGDPTIGIHIPAGGPMDFDACAESFARAFDFFPRHVPEHPAAAFTCGSWLLDPQFEGRLPESSNILRFLRAMYLHPLPGGTDAGLYERVFDRRRPAADTPLEGLTTLQRAVVGLLREGGSWRAGAGLFFPRDGRWGTQVYRAMWPGGVDEHFV